MTKKEYQQLVKKSPAFKGLPKLMQKKVLDATDDLIPKYVEIFLSEQNFLNKIKKDFLGKNEKSIRTFKQKIKNIKKEKMVRAETKSKKADLEASKALLKQMDNL